MRCSLTGIAIASLLSATTVAACTQPDFVEQAAPPAVYEVQLDELADRYAEASCKVREQCFGPSVLRDPGRQEFDGGCLAIFRPVVDVHVKTRLLPAIARGAVLYDPAGVGLFLRTLPARYCTERFTDGRNVLELGHGVVSLLAPGDPCFSDIECGAYQYCDTSSTCPGRCAPQKAAGDACTYDGECVPNADCVHGKCAAKRGVGESCGGSEPGCSHPMQCASILGALSECLNPSAMATQGDGERCAPFSDALQCKPGLSCQAQDPTQVIDLFCGAPSGQGEPCSIASALDGCATGLYCEPPAQGVSGTCEPSPTVGQPCGQSYASVMVCGAGLICNAASICQTVKELGERCTAEGECVSGTCVGGICRPQQGSCFPQ